MAYTKQNFTNGSTLDAMQLNAIEDGIVDVHNALEQKQPKGNYLTEVPDGYATEDFVKNKIAEAELSGSDVDLSGYATKGEVPTKTSQLTNDSGFLTEHQDLTDYAKKTDIPSIPVQSVNGKTGAVSLGAFDVGADPNGTADSVVSAHNASPDAHADIRELISELSGQNPSQGGGLSAAAASLLITILRDCPTYSPQTANIDALEALLTAHAAPDAPLPDGVTQTGSILTIISGVSVIQDGSTLNIA